MIQPKEFIVDYFKNIQTDYFVHRLNDIAGNFFKHKSEKRKSQHIIDLYSFYVQLLEIFLLNLLIMSAKQDQFFSIVFSKDQKKFRKEVERLFADNEYPEWIMEHLVFGINEKNQIKRYGEKKAIYSIILKEAVKDYLKDYEFLNAYKHGFRTQSFFGKKRLVISGFVISEGDSEIKYYSKIQNKIYENCIIFNFERVLNKCVFINSILYNSKLVFVARISKKQGKILLKHFYPKNIKAFNDNYGSFRNKLLLFEIFKKK